MSDVPLRGFQGAVLKLLRASDYQLTVTGCRELSPHYLRLSFDAGGLLTDRPLHPTMWIRMWFADGDKLHQRGYTLVDPDPEADTVDIEFAMHDGVASRWAQDARPGDTIEATMLGSNFTLPEPAPKGYVIVGDTASLPAINSLLTAIGDSPAQVPGKLLEGTKCGGQTFLGTRNRPRPRERDAGGTKTLDVVRPALGDAPDPGGCAVYRDGGPWPLPVNAPRRESLHDRPWSGGNLNNCARG